MIKRDIETFVYAIRNIKKQPLRSVTTICPFVAILVSLIAFIVSIVLFSINNGFGTQLEIMEGSWFEISDKALTKGNVALLTSGITSNIVLTVLAVGFVLLLVLVIILPRD